MRKIKKLWKVLARSISWNLKMPENNSEVTKADKKERGRSASHKDIREGLAGS
jgi:hypothetical protein